jgi:hypothetical protein
MPSTSRPDWVSKAPISSGLSLKNKYFLSLLMDIFIGRVVGVNPMGEKKAERRFFSNVQI